MDIVYILLVGMQLALGLVLLVMAFIYFTKKAFIEFGLVAFILGTSSLYAVYGVFYIQDNIMYVNPLFDFLLADYRKILIMPLLYIFLNHKFKVEDYKKVFIRHFTFPFVLVVIYITIKFTKKSYEDLYNCFWNPLLMRIIPFVLFVFYYVKGVLLLKKYKKDVVAPAYKRYSFFYHIVCIHLIYVLVYLTFRDFKLGENFIGSDIVGTSVMLIELVGMSMTLFIMIFEIDFFKKLFSKKNIVKYRLDTEATSNLEVFVSKLENEELYTNEDFNLKNLLKEYNIQEKDFKIYISNKYNNATIVDYLNELRIVKFIALTQQSDMDKYDITGLSKLAGFKSKATFYRVFKSVKGVTPKQYSDDIS